MSARRERVESTPFRSAEVEAPAPAPSTSPLRATLIIAGTTLVIEVFVGTGGQCFALVASLWGMTRLLESVSEFLSGRRLRARIAVARAGVWLVAAFLGVAAWRAGKVDAREAGMVGVIAAVEAYRAEHGAYPSSLRALVPRYLPRAPRVRRFGCGMCRVDYYRTPRGALLTWTVVPPFGRVTYDFASRQRGYLD